MFVKPTNGTPTPYTIGQLRHDNPQTSFPKTISDSTLAEYGVYRVVETDAPQVDSKTHHVKKSVQDVDSVWTVVWTIKKLDEDRAGDNVRGHRNSLLKETDYLALSDNTLTEAMATYRQALRDITDHVNFPYLTELDWPTKPE